MLKWSNPEVKIVFTDFTCMIHPLEDNVVDNPAI